MLVSGIEGDGRHLGRAIRVFVVDDHRMFVECLARLIGDVPDMDVVGHAWSGEEALASLPDHDHDVIVMGYDLRGRSGAVVVRELRERLGDLRVVMLSGRDDPHAEFAAAEVGCSAFLTKQRGAADLLDAVRTASAGQPSAPASTDGERRGVNPLSAREVVVLQLLADGLGTIEIASTLCISRNTVRAHVQRVITKLGAHSKLEAVAIGRRFGLL